MKISVQDLTQSSQSAWDATLEVGSLRLSSEIITKEDGVLRSFQIKEPMFKDMLALNGLEGEFSKRFFRFIGSGEPELPWCFGEQDDEVIERVRKHYETTDPVPPSA